jgi:hypothetical protein
MRSFNYAPLKAAIIFGLGVVVGGGFLGGFTQPTQRPVDSITATSDNASCTSGDAVADFVCRNTWLANTRHSYR